MKIDKAGFSFLGRLTCFSVGFALVCFAAQGSESSVSKVRLAARPVIDAYFLPSGEGWIVASDGSREFLFTTQDEGNHWSKEPLNLPLAAIFFMDDRQGFGVSLAGKNLTLVETNNGGRSWKELCATLELSSDTTVFDSMMMSGSGKAWVLGSQAGGRAVFLQIDTKKCSVNKPLPQSSGYDQRAMFGDSQSGELWLLGNDSILYSRDLGKSWDRQIARSTLREATSFSAGVALGNGTAIVVGAGVGGPVYRTIDHGIHWDLVAEFPFSQSHWLADIYFWDSGHGCAVGASRALFCTGDGGDTWEAKEVLPDLTEGKLDTDSVFTKIILVNNGRRGWALGNGGFIFQTDDCGNSWRPLDLFSVSGE